MKKAWENFFLGQSYQLSEYYGRYMLTEQQWTVHEKLAELPSKQSTRCTESVLLT